jgi:hypothetical protein
MRSKKEFKKLLETLDSSRLFIVGHLLTAQYISDCQEIQYDTELLNTGFQMRMVKV